MAARRHLGFWWFIAAVVALPFILDALMRWVEMHALAWFLPHQLYYLPLSWLGEPFFRPDSEVSFWVTLSGRVLAAVVYSGLLIGIRWLWRRRKTEL
jgi:hypothetical protein